MQYKLKVHTDQEAFDAVCVHLRTMTRRAKEGVWCRYETPTGDRCAIGALIDAEHLPDWRCAVGDLLDEENGAYAFGNELTDERDFLNLGDDYIDPEFLATLQELHDEADNWDHNGFREDALEHLAANWALQYTKP
jgi:hypothetical protein